MKVKTPHQTVGPFGKHHKHLGHFTQPAVINRGHNDGPRIIREGSMPGRTILEDYMQSYSGAVSDSGENFAPKGGSKSARIPIVRDDDTTERALRKSMQYRKQYSGGDDI